MIESPSKFKLDERFLTSIRSLNLEANAHNWRKILCMAGWSHLRKINLKYCQIDRAGLRLLITRQLDCLHDLSLDGNSIGVGVKLLIKMDLPHLKQLSLNRCSLGEEGARHLVKGWWPALWYLSMHSNNINSNGCLELRLIGGSKLEQLVLGRESRELANRNQVQPIIALNWVGSGAKYSSVASCVEKTYFSGQIGQAWGGCQEQ